MVSAEYNGVHSEGPGRSHHESENLLAFPCTRGRVQNFSALEKFLSNFQSGPARSNFLPGRQEAKCVSATNVSEASDHIHFSQRPVINVKAIFCA